MYIHWDLFASVVLEFSCKGSIENEEFFGSKIARIGFLGKSKCQINNNNQGHGCEATAASSEGSSVTWSWGPFRRDKRSPPRTTSEGSF